MPLLLAAPGADATFALTASDADSAALTAPVIAKGARYIRLPRENADGACRFLVG